MDKSKLWASGVVSGRLGEGCGVGGGVGGVDKGNAVVSGAFSGRAGRREHDPDRGNGGRLQFPTRPDEKRHDLVTGQIRSWRVFLGRAGRGGTIRIGIRFGRRVSPLTAAG